MPNVRGRGAEEPRAGGYHARGPGIVDTDRPTGDTGIMSGTDHAWNTVYNVLADHKQPILGVTNRPQLARDIVAALVREGFNLRGGDFREVERNNQ